MQHHHNGTFIIKSSQKSMQNREVNPPGSKTSRSTRPMGRLWPIFFLKLSGYHVISELSRLEHSELVLGPFENLTNLGQDPLGLRSNVYSIIWHITLPNDRRGHGATQIPDMVVQIFPQSITSIPSTCLHSKLEVCRYT